ncbi:MAG: HlyU family transcriptional regulator [Paracoccaceae bacterium]
MHTCAKGTGRVFPKQPIRTRAAVLRRAVKRVDQPSRNHARLDLSSFELEIVQRIYVPLLQTLRRRAAPQRQAETYEGFRIFRSRSRESRGTGWGARIEEVGGETRVHHLIRADVFQAEDEAVKYSLSKARQMIDQQGERLFG